MDVGKITLDQINVLIGPQLNRLEAIMARIERDVVRSCELEDRIKALEERVGRESS